MPRTLRRVVAVVLLIGLAALAFALPVSAGGRPFTISLTGAAERPDPGDEDASGTARLTVNPGLREVCWSVAVEDVDLPLVAAHIHEGTADVAGPPVIFLIPDGEIDADGIFSGCGTVDRSRAIALLVTPENFYVNVHTMLFPAGAARGQLG
ncbi:MAG TPA: CHRD domain-containing protein [Actinomycetota bacterium]|nr:CHRD domain-containing protein [Actinomycetota bacterium]